MLHPDGGAEPLAQSSDIMNNTTFDKPRLEPSTNGNGHAKQLASGCKVLTYDGISADFLNALGFEAQDISEVPPREWSVYSRDVVILTTTGDLNPGRPKIARRLVFDGGPKSCRIVTIPGAPGETVFEAMDNGGWGPDLIREALDADKPAVVDYSASDDPAKIAKVYLERYRTAEGSAFRCQGDEFLVHRGGAYRVKGRRETRNELAGATHEFFQELNEGITDEGKKKKTSVKVVNDVMMMVESLSLLPGHVEAPAWLDGEQPFPAAEVLPMRNALVHLPSYVAGKRAVLQPTPRFFGRYALDYDFDQDAPPPVEWLRFQEQVFPGDVESQMTLQEWFGYCLTSDTRQQKIAGLFGPLRSGKGTIARILKGLIGDENVAAPTLSGIATNFGCAPLIGKPLAIIADARLSGRADQAVITERLLSISGEDPLTVDRKHREAWTGKLPTRIMLLSNELPRLTDTSGALVGRLIIFRFTKSFYGREDKGLFDRLQKEMPGILLWAIEGWRRLQERGYFIQPESGKSMVDQMNDLSSPVGAFVRDRCEVGPGREVQTTLLFEEWERWCEENRMKPGTPPSFSRNLSAAVAGVDTQTTKRNSAPVRLYKGVGLRHAY